MNLNTHTQPIPQFYHRRLKISEEYALSAKIQIDEMYSENVKAGVELAALHGENRDLASQVQTLLKSRMSSSSSSSSVDAIDDMQQQNQALMKEVNHLKATVDSLNDNSNALALTSRLDSAVSELTALKDERSRQETLVSAIVQQRDMYRVLLAQSDSRYASPDKSKRADSEPALEASSTVVIELRAKLNNAELETEKVSDQLSRMKEYEATLTRQLDTAREEASKFRLEAKRAASDADYNKQRFERISKTLEGLQKEVSRANQEKSKLQSNVVATEQRSSSLQNSLDSLRREKSVAEAELRSALLSRDVAVASENRFKESIEVMRRELASKDALIESVKRIEAGLSNQNIEERKRLDEEIARLNKVVTEERQKASEERASMGRKLTLAEDNLKTVERAKSDAAVESANARERVALANAQVKALEDKVGTLTSQLMGMQADGLSTLPPAPMATTASASSAIVTPDLEATKKALVEAKKHAANYQKIATATDKELKDTVALYSRKEKETTAMLVRLKKSEETAKKSLASKIEALDALGKDLMNQKQSQETEKKRLEAQIADLRSQIASTKTEYADNSTKMNEMLDEIKSHMAASKSSQDAYERELTLHSEARSSLREARDTMDTERRMRQAAETELASLRAEFDGNKAVWKDEKDKLLVSIKTVEEMVKVSKGENELLHSQVATLSDASKRLEAGASTPADLESSNAKSLAEMREVVNFMRTERELVENKLEVMKQELECERVSASVAKRSLDEARGELKRREEVRMDGQMRSESARSCVSDSNLVMF